MRSCRVCLLIAVTIAGLARVANAATVCTAADARVVVDTAKHELALCEQRHEAAVFGVRLGRGGVGKTRQGDAKTPLGTYALGEPRASERFDVFIPIGYPTSEQRQRGYTGSDVGVHGPHRWVRWLGSLVNTFDSSDGCVGLAKDAEIAAIAAWVKKVHAHTIELR
jgi:murein L,D-transpeptidase YafK